MDIMAGWFYRALLPAVFAFFFLHERPSVRESTGIAMVGAGVLVPGFKK